MNVPKNPALQQVTISQCRPHEANRVVRDEDVAELADSIRAVGLLNPIHVRKSGDGFQIVAGERRWRAHRIIGAEAIPAFVYEECEDVTADTLRLVENDQRRDPTALDTARELRRIKNLYGLTHQGVAEKTGIPVDRIKRYLAVFHASDGVLDAIEKHRLPVKTALALTRYEKTHGEAKARPVIKKVVAGQLTSRDIDSLRKRGGENAKPVPTKTTPWERVEARIAKLIHENPQAAKGPVGRISKTLRDALRTKEEAA